MKIRIFCFLQDTVKNEKGKLCNWEKYLQHILFTKDFIQNT